MNLPDFLTQAPDGYLHVTGHRIGLANVVHYYNEGYSVEMLLGQFPTLNLAVLHKTIAFYLENRAEVDSYVAQCETELEELRATARKAPSLAELRGRLAAMQKQQAG